MTSTRSSRPRPPTSSTRSGGSASTSLPIARAEPTALDALTPLQARVLDGVRPRKVLTAEEIAVAVGVSAREARRALPDLELLGFVTAQGAGYRLPRKSDTAAPPERRS